VQEHLTVLPGGKKLPKKASAQFAGGYIPELDEGPELDPIMENFLLNFI
jgi:hypothetical protein